jgi:plastocyanin
MRRSMPAALLLALAGSLGTLPAARAETVDQKDKQFSQDAVTVKAGDAVQFTNSDQVAHDISVKGPDGSKLAGGMQKPGQAMSVTFPAPGEYKVMCLIHPKMKMTVTAK